MLRPLPYREPARPTVLVRELTREPHARELPVTHHALRGYPKYLASLLDAQSAEETQLDDLGAPGIDLRQRVQGLIERAQLSAHGRGR